MLDMAMVVAVIVAVGQFAKVYIPAKYIPLVSLIIGIASGLFVLPYETIAEGIINGIIAGLTACGLFDQTKIVTSKEVTE